MKRHAALVPLSHDHHHGLVQALRLRRAAEEPDAGARLAVARVFLEFFSRETLPHFQAEEEGVFPLLAGDDPRVVRALEDHVALQALAARLALDVEAGAARPELLRTLAARLHAHIRLEERDLFPLVEQVAFA
jgi:hypothetical protein